VGSPERVRGAILETLRAYMKLRGGDLTSDVYMDEELLRVRLNQYFRIALMPGDLRELITYLKDKGYVRYKRLPIGLPGQEREELWWRVSGDGFRLLTGELRDPSVIVSFPGR